MIKSYRVTSSEVGSRTDVFIAKLYPKFTRSSLEKLFTDGLITVENVKLKPSHRLKEHEVVKVDQKYFTKQPPIIDIPVIYEDNNVVVMDKPEGVLTHAKGPLLVEATVASFISSRLDKKLAVGNRAGIVHRLDRATSGVIIAAKNQQSLTMLQKQFSQRKAKKKYLAIVQGTPSSSRAIIDAPILRNPAKLQTFKVDPEGKSATTEYEVVQQFSHGGKEYSLIELRPMSGRTHQLRVHMAYIGHPIAGDPIYSSGKGSLMLHATSLEVTIPVGQRKIFTSPMPMRFKEFING